MRALSTLASRALFVAALVAVSGASTAIATTAHAQPRRVTRQAATANPRVIVLSFEGWHADEAREAVAEALATDYTVVPEADAITAADEIRVDVGTPEGMAAVVQHLRIDLVVGGSITGTGRRSQLTLFVLDANGNELANAEVPGPSRAAAMGPIGQAAIESCAIAYQALPRAPEPEPEPQPEDPEGRSLDELEHERPGARPGWGDPDRADAPSANRWHQPLFTAALFGDIGSRTAGLNPGPTETIYGFGSIGRLGLTVDTRPFAQNDDALRGLYAHLDLGFSLGTLYLPANEAEDALPAQSVAFEIDVGYALTIAEAVELIGSIGFGYDAFSQAEPARIFNNDFPSTAYPYLPITLGGRVRLLPSSISGVDLHLEAAAGPRILFGGGELAAIDGPFFPPVGGINCASPTRDLDCGNFGSVGGVGVNFYAGLGLIIDPGITLGLRFQYVGYFLGFSEGVGARAKESGTDENMRLQLLAGYSFR
jgi:hypothetical protein